MPVVAARSPRRNETKSWSWRDALRWADGGPRSGRGRRWGLKSGAGGRARRVHACACVCARVCVSRLGTAAGTGSARVAPRPGLLRLGYRSQLRGPPAGGGAASRPPRAHRGSAPGVKKERGGSPEAGGTWSRGLSELYMPSQGWTALIWNT